MSWVWTTEAAGSVQKRVIEHQIGDRKCHTGQDQTVGFFFSAQAWPCHFITDMTRKQLSCAGAACAGAAGSGPLHTLLLEGLDQCELGARNQALAFWRDADC